MWVIYVKVTINGGILFRGRLHGQGYWVYFKIPLFFGAAIRREALPISRSALCLQARNGSARSDKNQDYMHKREVLFLPCTHVIARRLPFLPAKNPFFTMTQTGQATAPAVSIYRVDAHQLPDRELFI
jgi:hypothetical protein